jgi:hypothetical protein
MQVDAKWMYQQPPALNKPSDHLERGEFYTVLKNSVI